LAADPAPDPTGDAAAPVPRGGAAASLAAVLRNRDIRNIELAWTLGIGVDWALLVVSLLVAYAAGGPALVGLVSVTRMVPAALVNLLFDTGRLRRPERALVGVGLVRAGAAAVIAAGVVAGSPAVVLVALAAGSAAGALFRPTMMALLPSVATTPDELVSANVVTALGESLGTFAGPAIAGIALARSGAAPVAALAAAVGIVMAVAMLRVRVADAARPPRGERASRVAIVSGARELARRPPTATVMGSLFAQVIVRGALTTYLAVLAIEVLGMGQPGVGTLGAAMGIGGLVGAAAALLAGPRGGMAGLHAVALTLWGVPLVVIGLAPVPAVAIIALAAVGLGNSLVDVAGFTLLQRGSDSSARSAVFSFLEVGAAAGISVGGVAGALLLAQLGINGALVATGILLPIVAIVAQPFARRIDADAALTEDRAAVLRSVSLFRPLPITALERLAAGMRSTTYAPGATLMTEGEPGTFYAVIDRGQVDVSANGHMLRRQGHGDGIGEIALLRALPRTATVTAVGPVEAWIIDCGTFLEAVTGHPDSQRAATAVVEERLGRGGSEPADQG
jgi:hypothetical protein